MQPPEIRGEALGRAHDVLSAHGAVRGLELARPDLDDARALVDCDPEPLDGVREPRDELRGLDIGSVRVPDRGPGARDVDALLRLIGFEELEVGVLPAPLPAAKARSRASCAGV